MTGVDAADQRKPMTFCTRISESPAQVSEMDREPVGLLVMVDSIRGVAISNRKKRRADEARSRRRAGKHLGRESCKNPWNGAYEVFLSCMEHLA